MKKQKLWALYHLDSEWRWSAGGFVSDVSRSSGHKEGKISKLAINSNVCVCVFVKVRADVLLFSVEEENTDQFTEWFGWVMMVLLKSGEEKWQDSVFCWEEIRHQWDCNPIAGYFSVTPSCWAPGHRKGLYREAHAHTRCHYQQLLYTHTPSETTESLKELYRNLYRNSLLLSIMSWPWSLVSQGDINSIIASNKI